MMLPLTTAEKDFLSGLTADNTSVHVYLTTGVKLTGIIDAFDDAALFLRGRGHVQMIYRHGIVTVVPTTGPVAV